LSLFAADKKRGWLMDFASMSVKSIHILRVDPGEDVLEAVKRFVKEADLRQAVILRVRDAGRVPPPLGDA
jgi:Plants and Prokaryotes Conserved (PCC) domain